MHSLSWRQAWERNHKSDAGSPSTPRMSLSANYAFFRKEPSTETIFQSVEEGGNLNSALQCVSKELKKARRNIHSTAFNITSHYRILLFLLMNQIPEKQPAPNLKLGNVSPKTQPHFPSLESCSATQCLALGVTGPQAETLRSWRLVLLNCSAWPNMCAFPPQLTGTIRSTAVTLVTDWRWALLP